ncbi:MAG TPA: FHA domain-containing protein [Anaerolineaceae bacterium]|nr:FHA domain-containing protein [Anaerolineaceae bacterium]
MIPTHRLVLSVGPNAGRFFPIVKADTIIGREAGDDIIIKDPEISRKHARIFLQGANYFIEDLGSTNGTSVNGARIQIASPLRVGDVIKLGEKTSLVFEPITEADTILNPNVQSPATIPAQGEPVFPPAPAQMPNQQPPVYQRVPPVQPPYQQPPFQQPVPQYQAPRPQPVVPPPPVQDYAEPPYLEPVQKKGLPTWAILLIILGVLVLCIGCAALVLTMTPLGCTVYELFGMECVTF